MKIAFTTLGCKLNFAETSTYRRDFEKAGWQAVRWDEAADVYLVNTCSVTSHSDYKCRNIINKCHRANPSAAIVVTGCYASLKRDEVEALEGVRLVFDSGQKHLIVRSTIQLFSDTHAQGSNKSALSACEIPSYDSGFKANGAPFNRDIEVALHDGSPKSRTAMFPAFSGGERTRSFLKVQDGCDNFCAYCTVPYARGRSRNLPISELRKQAGQIAATGVKEIVLTGVNTGDFGRTTGESFLDLIRVLNDVEGIERYRISSIEPNLLSEEIVDWIAGGTKFLPHFHIPLQVGCDEILRSMGRHYDTALFASRIEYIRSKMEAPGRSKVFFGIDVIAGLPGETRECFEQSFSFLKDRIRPAYLHLFPYSKRPGTRAAAMKDQVQDRVKSERMARLQELCELLHEEFLKANKGLPEKVLWEKAEKGGKMSGYTGNYIRMETAYDPAKVGTIEEVII